MIEPNWGLLCEPEDGRVGVRDPVVWWGFEPAFVAGELVGRGVQGVEGGVPQLAVVNHCPGVQRHRIGQRPDDHAGC